MIAKYIPHENYPPFLKGLLVCFRMFIGALYSKFNEVINHVTTNCLHGIRIKVYHVRMYL